MTAGIVSRYASQPPSRERVELILSQLDGLPTLPSIAARLLAATTSDESSVRDVVEIIETDASLTATVLRLAQRADLGVRGQTITVGRAVQLLGFSAVRNLVLTIQVFESFPDPVRNARAAETRKGLWTHSLAVACASEFLGRKLGGTALGSDAFVCGLLHDIGKLALDAILPKSYGRVVDRVAREGACICDVERELLGLDHTSAGKRLVGRWQLSQAIVECTWLHHQNPDALPTSVVHTRLLGIVHLADNLVRRQGMGYSGYQYVEDVDELAGKLGLNASVIGEVLTHLPKMLETFGGLSGLDDLSSGGDYEESLLAANKQLGRLNAKLAESNRRLQGRSACFTALERFTKMLGTNASICDVCMAAASNMREMLEIDGALAFYSDGSSRCVYTGSAGLHDRDCVAAVTDLGELHESFTTDLAPASGSAGGFVAAPSGGEELWQRGTGSRATADLWLFPLRAGEDAAAGVLVSAGEDTLARFRSFPDELLALSVAFGRALAAAKTRVESERLAEELLDSNRRVQAAQRETVRTHSIAMIAEMAAGAAHEINNPLSVISGRAQMAAAECTDPSLARSLATIMDQTRRATEIVTKLMDFAKPEPPTPVLKSVGEFLETLCQHWRGGSSFRGEALTLAVADRATTFYADESQLRHIMDAVMANAAEATQPETARVHVNSPSRASDETVRIVVEDNGVGMTREVLEHAIDPFFSSRSAGRGRGLGLSQAYRFAEINGGRLWLESTPDRGTKVTIELPARAPGS